MKSTLNEIRLYFFEHCGYFGGSGGLFFGLFLFGKAFDSFFFILRLMLLEGVQTFPAESFVRPDFSIVPK